MLDIECNGSLAKSLDCHSKTQYTVTLLLNISVLSVEESNEDPS